MKDFFGDVPIFVEVAKRKNFSRAAAALGMPVSTVSRRIQALENTLGTALFFRSARKVELTDGGQKFFERCAFIVAEAEAAREELAGNMGGSSGRVRVSMPLEIYHIYLHDVLNEFAAAHPEISLHINLAERWVDLHSEPFDLDLRLGVLPDSNLRARKLITLQPALYAAPSLFTSRPMPAEPADLAALPCIPLFLHGDIWVMSDGERLESVEIKAAHIASSTSVAFEMALAGLGVAWQMPAAAMQYVESGLVMRILPAWRHFAVDLNMVMATPRQPTRVRVFMDYLAEYFASLPV